MMKLIIILFLTIVIHNYSNILKLLPLTIYLLSECLPVVYNQCLRHMALLVVMTWVCLSTQTSFSLSAGDNPNICIMVTLFGQRSLHRLHATCHGVFYNCTHKNTDINTSDSFLVSSLQFTVQRTQTCSNEGLKSVHLSM